MDPNKVIYFGQTDARNQKVPFGIKSKDRSRHVYVIGKTGMGKSTLLENMAVQDIQNGSGMAFIDPHGKTADLLLEYVPKERIDDVIYFAPFDTDYPISFNVMEDVGADKRHLVANGLMSAFKKIWVDAWSARMEYILSNILLALLEYPESTIIGVNRMLADKDYRKKVVDNISDPSVKAFWTDEFAKYGERYMQEAGAAIQNKIGQFVANPLVRNIIGQPKSSFDIRKVMDDRKILIINLSKGRVGETNANLLGSMLITKIYLGAMSRADVSETVLNTLPQFYLFVDEFQSFANESFADILSEARKYKLNLTIAHQYIEQMSEEVRAAVFGNVGTMITFRVGAYDAEVLEKEFMPTFTAEDLVNLGFVQIYLKLMIEGVTSPPFSATTLPPIKKSDLTFKDEIIEHSRQKFARPREVVEKEIQEWHRPITLTRSDRPEEPRREREFSRDRGGERGPGRSERSDTPRREPRPEIRQERAPSPPPPPKPQVQASLPVEPQSPSSLPPPPIPQKMPPQKNPFEGLVFGQDGKLEVKGARRPSVSEPPQDQKPASLESLKQKPKKSTPDAKAPSPENMSNLKQALAAVMEKSKSEVQEKPKHVPHVAPLPSSPPPPQSQPHQSREPHKHSQPHHVKKETEKSEHKHHDHEKKHEKKPEPREVPKEVLQKILDAS